MSMYTWRDIPQDLHRKWKSIADLRGVRMDELLEKALRAYLEMLDKRVRSEPVMKESSNDDVD